MKTKIIAFIFALLCVACSNSTVIKYHPANKNVPPIDKSLALKPPMGWNSWDCLGWDANETEVRAAAEYMAKNLKYLGYEYIVIDQMWYGDEKASNFEDFVHETISTKPNYNMDGFGRLLPDTVKYPSARGGKGFKPLANYLHSLGLKFGLHLLRGIPWKAADNNLPIKGTPYKAASIAEPDSGCVWYDGFYGVNMSKPGAQEYYNSVFELYSEWGVDFIKADDIVNIPELEGIGKASRTCSKKIVLSIVGGRFPMEVQKANAHMSRLGADFWDVWEMLKRGFPLAAKAAKYAEPGFWPDLDMLPIGKIGLKISYKGPDSRISNFNKDELHSLLTLYYISRSPLMIGGYLPETDTLTLNLLKNKEALFVNRDCINSRQIKFKNAIIIWAADIPGCDDKYLAFFNQWESSEPINIKVTWSQLGLKGNEYKVHDLWSKKDLGIFKDDFSAAVKAHDAGLYKISK